MIEPIISSDVLDVCWRIIEAKNCAVNICERGSVRIVSIIEANRTRQFTNSDSNKLISNLTNYLQAGNENETFFS